MATISFLWHLHQPAYRTADGVSHAPWVLLHAGGSYTTLARAIERTSARGHVVNIVPTLLEQLLAYRDRRVVDPVVDALTTPVTDLDEHQRSTVVQWSAHVSPRQLERSPRLGELRETRRDRLTESDLRDLQALTILAHAGESAWRDEDLAPLNHKGRDFDAGDLKIIARWLWEQPARLIDRWRRLADLPGVEIATSPFAHPIMPLLIDTGVVRRSWPPGEAPDVPPFAYPEDARLQLRTGLDFMRSHGFRSEGCWPPEGSVSVEALEIYDQLGVRWLVTDEEILERSLDRPIRSGGETPAPLYRPWRGPSASPMVFFRDRQLSDLIGFEYGRWSDEGVAAIDFVERLKRCSAELTEDACIVIALDGENAWSHFPAGGGLFLETLMELLNQPEPGIEPATLGQLTRRLRPGTLAELHPGSWIHAIFATWIGHPEKTRAWELLSAVRRAMPEGEIPRSMVLAEGSDWFWWLGEDNPTELAPLYDRIYRHHLADALASAEVPSPVDLDQPLKTTEERHG
jgi:alpha-amylase/alpha-mannosidase (GH57 family)